MPLLEASPANPWTAEAAIHATVEQERSPETILARLEEEREALVGEQRQRISQYIVGIRPVLQGVLVADLDPQVAGEFDGSSITIATSTLDVHARPCLAGRQAAGGRGSIEETLAAAEETKEHETYHRDHDHTGPMIAGASVEGETVATIGGHAFTETALIEGLTVAKTGEEFVSQEYVQFAGEVRSAVAAAGITLDDLEEAVDKKDLRGVDDENRDAYRAGHM